MKEKFFDEIDYIRTESFNDYIKNKIKIVIIEIYGEEIN